MIKNITTKKVLVKDFEICKTPFQKFRGLMFRKPTNLVFIFNRLMKVSLHMWFVFYRINVIFLDDKFKVVDLKKNFLPWTFYTSKKKCKYIIEIPSKVNVSIGDCLKLENL
jgi:uncharacterized protein